MIRKRKFLLYEGTGGIILKKKKELVGWNGKLHVDFYLNYFCLVHRFSAQREVERSFALENDKMHLVFLS